MDFREVRNKLRQKKTEYQSLRDDYEILRQNINANVSAKKALRKEISDLTKIFRELRDDDDGEVIQRTGSRNESLPPFQ